MNSKSMINDLTQGPVTKQLMKFAYPFILSNLLQTVYNLVDMIVVGQFVGAAGLSAVGVGGDLLHLFTFICMGFASAGQIMISQYVGTKDYKAINRTIGTMFTFILGLSLVVMAVGFILVDVLLDWMNVPVEAYSHAHDYTFVCYAGMFFIFGYNTVAAILRGMGDSKLPFVFIAIAAVSNLLLDLLFVAVFKMGAMGAALATVIGQAISFICSLVYLYIKRESFGFDFKPKSFAVDGDKLKILLKLGVPMMLQHSAISISCLFVGSFINAYGVVASAVTGVGNKLGTVASVVTSALNTAGSSMIGQNFGAGKQDRVSKIVYVVMWISFAFSAILSVIMFLFPEEVFSLFNTDPEVLAMARAYSIIAILNFFGFATRAPAIALVNGLGYASLSLAMGILDGIVVRIGLALLMGITFGMGIQGFWYGSVIAGYMYGILGGWYFFSGRWKKRKLVIAKN